MPPTSVSLAEEGAEIMSFKIVDDGVFDRKGLLEYMVDKPARHPGSSGCRNIKDVESDLKAVRPSARVHACRALTSAICYSKLRQITKELGSSRQSLTTMGSRPCRSTCTTFARTQRTRCATYCVPSRSARVQTFSKRHVQSPASLISMAHL